VRYLLLADGNTYVCRGWDALVEGLVWAREQGYKSAKARCCGWELDRPLLPSECAELVEAATRVALAAREPHSQGVPRGGPAGCPTH
jgi:hypothetical protein